MAYTVDIIFTVDVVYTADMIYTIDMVYFVDMWTWGQRAAEAKGAEGAETLKLPQNVPARTVSSPDDPV